MRFDSGDDLLARLLESRSRLEEKLRRPPTMTELANDVRVPESKITEALRAAAEPLPDFDDRD